MRLLSSGQKDNNVYRMVVHLMGEGWTTQVDYIASSGFVYRGSSTRCMKKFNAHGGGCMPLSLPSAIDANFSKDHDRPSLRLDSSR